MCIRDRDHGIHGKVQGKTGYLAVERAFERRQGMKRWERNIFYSLNRETVPEYDKGVCRRSIELVKEEGRQIERRKMTDREFFKGQIRWIPARIWLLQLAVLSLCCLTFTQMTDRGEGSLAWVSVSMAGPLFQMCIRDRPSAHGQAAQTGGDHSAQISCPLSG